MAQTTLNVRIDADVKKAFDEFCVAVGLNSSTAVNMFVKTVIRENRIPFEVSIDPFYSKSNIDYLKQSIEQINQGKVIVKTMEELEAMENE